MTDVAILVPRRAGRADRDRLWTFARGWWASTFPRWPIVVGHHDDGPFNRSAAVNAAAREAGDWKVALIIDADVFGERDAILEAIDVARDGRPASGFDVRRNLKRSSTERILRGHRGELERLALASTHPACISGAFAIGRDLWDQVGGFDELFVGWGFEDTAFAIATETISGADLYRARAPLWHLWHPRSPEHDSTLPGFRANLARRERYTAARGDRRAIKVLLAERDAPLELEPVATPAKSAPNIPRIIHRTVPADTDDEVERWWARFGELHPGWTLRTHRDPLDPRAWPETSDLWPLCRSGAQRAGLIRLEALWRDGGIYVDSDVEPYRNLEPLLGLEAFAGWEDAKVVPDAVLGARPHHPAFRIMLDRARAAILAGANAWDSGPGVTTSTLPGRPDVLLLPPGSFYPYHYTRKDELRSVDHKTAQPWALAAHHWRGSWLDTVSTPAPATGDRIDFLATEPHFLDHLAPIWHALEGNHHRGDFYIAPELEPAAHAHGITPAPGTIRRAKTLTVVASIGDFTRAERCGRPLVISEHGAGQSYSSRSSSYVGGAGRDKARLVLVPNEAASDRSRRYYPGKRTAVVGCPKLDDLLEIPKPPGPPTVAISFHWRAEAVCPEAGSALDHYAAALPGLRAELERAGVRLIGHGHPRILAEVEPIYTRAGIPTCSSFREVVERAHLYAVDNSSTLFEFAALGRPVVVLNSPSYRRTVEHGLRFWKEASVGLNVNEPADLVEIILRALEDPDDVARSREQSVARVYPVRDGSSASRAARAVLDLVAKTCPVCGTLGHACGPKTSVEPVDRLTRREDRMPGPLKRYPNPERPGAFLKLSEKTARAMGLAGPVEEPGTPPPITSSTVRGARRSRSEAPVVVDAPITGAAPSQEESDDETAELVPAGAMRPSGPTRRARAKASAPDPEPDEDDNPPGAPDAPSTDPPRAKPRPAPSSRRRRRVTEG